MESIQIKRFDFKDEVWTWKEFIGALIVAFVVVPILIEYLLHAYINNILANDLYAGTLTGLIMAICFLYSIYMISLEPHHLTWKDIGLRSFPIQYLTWIILWIILLIIVGIIILFVMSWFGVSYENSKTASIQLQVTPANLIIGFVSASVISPFYEEVFYRGFIYKWLRGKWGIYTGMTVSSLIFMLVHIPTYNVLPITFVSGLVFSWTYERTGSVIPAMIIHGCLNGIAVIATALA
ncbi:type II CAAX endopeptidase family protein [Cytobacillus sp. IB215316]|uniref:CPBP family intramembrane glutamic endopeptidase n=1 Tax=Cytobacillus sp. IB215316 TaxID=3097354 RepID=UPI002A0BC563|nr:type II CAAX endopeptidase family protein [Cytobacillus sp. IB215316]MDX8360596.1 type II CAAX endopeptidase family protein [Cytobacillus sp. IB215316]